MNSTIPFLGGVPFYGGECAFHFLMNYFIHFSLAPWWERVRMRRQLIFILIWCCESRMRVYPANTENGQNIIKKNVKE
jgi:hypothetical protein